MKKTIKALFVSLFLILTVSDSFAAEKKNKPKIRTVDNYVAVFDFEVRTGDKDISRTLADSVIHEFSQSDKYEVIDRGNMNKILKEQKFQMSGCVAQECKVDAGQVLGVGKIVNGSVGKMGKTYYLTLQLIDVQTGKVEFSAEDKCKCELDELLDSTKRLAKKLLGEKFEQPVTTAPKPATVVESKAEAEEIAKAKAKAEEIAKAKAEEIERAKAEQVAKVKAEAETKQQGLKTTSAAVAPIAVSSTFIASDDRFVKLSSGVVRDTKSGLEWYAGPDKDTGWDDANAWAAGLNVDGGGWRMPKITELKGLYQKGAGSRNMTSLLETTDWWVWSGEVTGLTVWTVDFSDGRELLDKRNNSNHTRGFAVRSTSALETLSIPKQPELQPTTGETARDGRFIAYSNGTVSDTKTNLMWAAKDNGSDINWVNAKSYCENYRGGGYSDWRMPTQDELAGLYDATKTYKSACGYDVELTELIRLTCSWVWASKTRGSGAAHFGFSNGTRHWPFQSNDFSVRALPVRSEAKEIAKTKAKAETIATPSEPMIAAIVKSTEPEQKITNSIGMTFVYIKPGTFMMGSPSGLFSGESGRYDNERQHQVTLTRGFYMGETEVTVNQWRIFMRDTGYKTDAETIGGAYVLKEKWEKKEGTYWDNPSFVQSDNHPVTCVSWNDVQAFIRWINRKEGINYRLPTEAEWEYAARAGSESAFAGGGITKTDCSHDPILDALGWYCGNSGKKTHPVAQKNPNSWGLYDMHGNVWDWCQDWYGEYPSGSVTDPAGPLSGSDRVVRGGGWNNSARYSRSAARDKSTPGYSSFNIGFRLSRTPLREQDEPPVLTAPAPTTANIPKQPELQPTAGEIARDGRFIAYSNGTVSDTNTNLMWAAKDNGNNINWANAKSYCENYRGGGYTDWRMPTQDELAGLYNSAKTYKSNCGYNVYLTELIRLTCTWMWASEKSGSDAAVFNFGFGTRNWDPRSAAGGYPALPVRSGK